LINRHKTKIKPECFGLKFDAFEFKKLIRFKETFLEEN